MNKTNQSRLALNKETLEDLNMEKLRGGLGLSKKANKLEWIETAGSCGIETCDDPNTRPR